MIHTNKRGFSLIELLTVIVILALLSTLLIPSLSRAKAVARQVQCANNLHHIGQACGRHDVVFSTGEIVRMKQAGPCIYCRTTG